MKIGIVGGGLAGLCLSWVFQECGLDVQIFAQDDPNDATRHSAGMLNPITGWNSAPSWQFHTFYPFAIRFYSHLARIFKTPTLRSYRYERFFRNSRERQKLAHKYATIDDYPTRITTQIPVCSKGPIRNDWGGYFLPQLDVADISTIRRVLIDRFRERDIYHIEPFDYNALRIGGSRVRYHEHTYDRIVFCEGYQAPNNPWFNYLPFLAQSSATLQIENAQVSPDTIYNRGRWLMPYSKGVFRLGSTHTPFPSSTSPSMHYDSLTQHASDMFTSDYHILQMDTGYKMKTTDHRPVLGAHPRYPQLMIMNGFGSKGTLAIPYCSDLLSRHIRQGAVIPDSMAINRWPTN